MQLKQDHYRTLEEIQRIVSCGPFNVLNINDRARVVYLFVLIRKIFDSIISEDNGEKYGLLNFYCTWVIHINIDRNKECKKKIKELSQLIIDNKDNPNISEVLSEALSMNSIPDQINELIISCGMTTKNLIDGKAWKEIEPILINLILTAPLIDESGKEHLKEISIFLSYGPFFGLFNMPLDKRLYGFKIITKDNEAGQSYAVAIVDKYNNYFYA